MPTPADFAVETEELPALQPGQMLLRARWLSLDPYMRPAMGVPESVGKTIVGGTVSEVVESRADGWEPVDLVRLLRLAGVQHRPPDACSGTTQTSPSNGGKRPSAYWG